MTEDIKRDPLKWGIGFVLSVTLWTWVHFAFWVESPSRLIFQYDGVFASPVLCNGDCPRDVLSELALLSVRPSQKVYRYAEWCLDRPAEGRVEIRFSQPSFDPIPFQHSNFGRVGCHSKFLPVPLPDSLIPGEPLTISVTLVYPREAMPSLVTEVPPITVMVR